MDIVVYNNDLELVDDIDIFNSFIWATRYNTEGDFEIRLPLIDKYINLFQLKLEEDIFVDYKPSLQPMIVEDVNIVDGVDEREIVVTGRSLLSVLDRRVVMLQNFENVKISTPSDLKDKIISILRSSIDSISQLNHPINNRSLSIRIGDASLSQINKSNIDAVDFSMPYIFKNVFGTPSNSILKEIADFFKIGIKTWVSEDGNILFELYTGDDYTYDQHVNPPVLFSERLQNIFSSTSANTIRNFKNLGIVIGTDEEKTTVFCMLPGANERNMREVILRPSDINKPKDMSTEDYKKMLKERGMIELKKMAYKTIYDGKIDPHNSLSPIKLGDKVVREDLFGTYQNVQCTEIITSITREGIEVIPSFVNI